MEVPVLSVDSPPLAERVAQSAVRSSRHGAPGAGPLLFRRPPLTLYLDIFHLLCGLADLAADEYRKLARGAEIRGDAVGQQASGIGYLR